MPPPHFPLISSYWYKNVFINLLGILYDNLWFCDPWFYEQNYLSPVTYKIQWLDIPPFCHFMRIAHVTEAPSTGAALFKQTEETQITIKNYQLASKLS